jgi:site-specific DNA recombinase
MKPGAHVNTVIGTNRMGCSAHRDRGTCQNNKTISISQIEKRVFSGLSAALRDENLFDEYEREFRAAFEALSNVEEKSAADSSQEIKNIERRIDVLLGVLETSEQVSSVVARLKKLEEEKSELQRTKPRKASRAIPLPKDLNQVFSKQIEDLASALDLLP